MANQQIIKKIALNTLTLESKSISNLSKVIDSNFCEIINTLKICRGKIVITGIGKSAIIANKIVATLNSTGTPSIFMHAADAIHGDLGIIKKDDIIICISKSGNTQEIKDLVPFLNMKKNPLIAITGDVDSFLAKNSTVVLNSHVNIEVCPNNLAPTNSTTAQLVIGDAIAVTLVKIKGFTSHDFAKFHPGGSLGKKLYLKVKDLIDVDARPMVLEDDNIKSVIIEISNKMLGITPVFSKNLIVGVITDGDLRRTLLNHSDISMLKAKDIMSINPKIIDSETMASEALEIMKGNKISQLIVTTDKQYSGVIHIQSLIKEGIS